MLQTVAASAASIKSSIEQDVRAHVVALQNYGESKSERLKGVTANIWLSEASLFLALFQPYQSVAWLTPTLEVRWVGSRKGVNMSGERIAAFTQGHKEPLKAAWNVGETLVVPARNRDDGRLQLGIYVPIFTDEAFRGYMFGLLDLQTLLDAIISRHRFQDFSIAVYGDVEQVFTRLDPMTNLQDEWRKTAIIEFYPNTWRLEVWPTTELIDRTQTILPQAALITGLLLTALLTVVHLFQVRIGRERGEAERTLAERERRLRGVFDNVADAVITFDEGNTIDTFNPAAERIFGYSAEEVCAQDVRSLIPVPIRGEPDNGADGDRSHGLARATTVDAVEATGRRKDGTEFPIDLSISEMGLGEIRLFVGVARDISSRKKIEAQLQQAQKMEAVGRLTGGVAHEFNNLLHAVLGSLELLKDMVGKDAESRMLLETATKAAERGADITSSLLSFGRRQNLTPRAVDLNRVVSALIPVMESILGETVKIETVHAQNSWEVTADRSQVESALMNLIMNARDAIPGEGRVIIEIANVHVNDDFARNFDEAIPGDYVRLSVTDTGDGMSSEVIEHVFEPFYSTKEVGKGTGLGLSMVYGFAKQSNGIVAIDSEVGRGTKVELFLPRATEGEATDEVKR